MGQFKRVKIAVFFNKKDKTDTGEQQHDAAGEKNIGNLFFLSIYYPKRERKVGFHLTICCCSVPFLLMDCFQLAKAHRKTDVSFSFLFLFFFFSFLFELPVGVFRHVESLIFISKVRIYRQRGQQQRASGWMDGGLELRE
jgi:hypothetical protein